MKVIFYIGVVILLGSIGYNLYFLNFNQALLGSYNQPYIIGLGAGVCGLLVALILFRYSALKKNLQK